MAGLVKAAVAWSAADGTAKALTTSYVATSQASAWHDIYNGSEVALALKASGTDGTSIDAVIEASFDGGTTGYLLPAITSSVAGVVDFDPAILTFPGAALGSGIATKQPLSPGVPVPPGTKVRVLAKRTGGDATTAAILTLLVMEV